MKQVAAPSVELQQFVEQYFLSEWKWRLEQDSSLLHKLHGSELDVAAKLVCANLPTGEIQIVNAAAGLHVDAAIPILRTMLGEKREAWELFEVVKALYELQDLGLQDVYSVAERGVRRGGDAAVYFILSSIHALFSPEQNRQLIDIALRRDSYDIRASAYRAAVAIQYIRAHGGRYTPELRSEIYRKEMAAATVGSDEPMLFAQLQYYAGEGTYKDPRLFEERLSELWADDPGSRRMPLFTEINQGK